LAKSYGYRLALCISVSSCALVTVSWNSEGAGQTTDKGMVIELPATADELVVCSCVSDIPGKHCCVDNVYVTMATSILSLSITELEAVSSKKEKKRKGM